MNVFSRAYIDSLFDDYQQDPSSLPPEWQTYFESFDPANNEIDFSSLPVASNSSASASDHNTTNSRSVAQLQDRVDILFVGFVVIVFI